MMTLQLRVMILTETEIEWKTSSQEVPRSFKGGQFETGDVKVSEAREFLRDLLRRRSLDVCVTRNKLTGHRLPF